MNKLIFILTFSTIAFCGVAQVKLQNLRTENLTNPVGLDQTKPHLSWQLISDKRNVMQTAYEIRVSETTVSISKGEVWNTGKVTSDQSIHIIYDGQILKPKQRYFW